MVRLTICLFSQFFSLFFYRPTETFKAESYCGGRIGAVSLIALKSQQHQSNDILSSVFVLCIEVRKHSFHIRTGTTAGRHRSDGELPASRNDRQRNLAECAHPVILVPESHNQNLLQDTQAGRADDHSSRCF